MKQNLPPLEIRAKEDDTIRVQADDLLHASGTIYLDDRRVDERYKGTPLAWCNEGYVIRFHPDFHWHFGVDALGQTVAVALTKERS
jgi:hypothetical protein